jgi:hypothetical protein
MKKTLLAAALALVSVSASAWWGWGGPWSGPWGGYYPYYGYAPYGYGVPVVPAYGYAPYAYAPWAAAPFADDLSQDGFPGDDAKALFEQADAEREKYQQESDARREAFRARTEAQLKAAEARRQAWRDSMPSYGPFGAGPEAPAEAPAAGQ